MKALKGGLKKRFLLMPEEHTVVVRQTSRWGQSILITLICLGTSIVVTAWFYKLDEIITVQGRLVPKAGGVEIKSPMGGKLEKLLVMNGEKITEGQNLVKMNMKQYEKKIVDLKIQLKIEKEKLKDNLKSNEIRIQTLKRNLLLTENILRKLKPLQTGGAISEIQILQQKNKIATQEDEINQEITKTERIRNDSKGKIATLNGEINQLSIQMKNKYLKAPISGIIFDLKPDNDEYITRIGEPLMSIVPKKGLGALVTIGNKDIGFIKKGQKVEVRVDTFPFTEYGQLNGEISRIGADALPPDSLIKTYHFPIDIELEKSTLQTKSGQTIQLQSGMTITANLELRKRRLIEIVSDIFTNRKESMKRLRQP